MTVLVASALLLGARPARALNPIQAENAQPGTPASQWDIIGVGDPSIQGFATDISVNRGGTVTFKIDTDAAAYHIDIYRLGYYGGDGARLQGTGLITATLPQAQPTPASDALTGLVDCGNWAESAHWDVPANAVSGIYIARLERDDTHGASHIVFIVRDDASTSDLLFKTADCTWQAYNVYGGNSLYVGSVPRSNGNAAKVSFNRPFSTRGGGGGSGSSEDWLFNAEYPMVRFLESNGYDVSYTTDLDTDRDPTHIVQHHVFLTAGHDEYWSAGERAAVTAARDAGVHLALFDGNEVYWKTRWEPSIDGSNTDHRTLVCYKEGTLGENVCGGKCDPTSAWTGLWRDGCAFTPPSDGCNPENSLTGQISWDGTTGAIQVPDTYKSLRLWRNTSVATLGAGQTATLGSNTLGYEWDWDQYPATYPAGRILLSNTQLDGKTHHLSLYRHSSGALVFGAGTVQWSWGLDSNHDRGNDPTVPAMQQATVNLLADMGVQPATLQPGLSAANPSTDAQAPASAITSPLQGASLPSGTPVTITGTAADAGGGVVAGVDVSTDGGATWQPATGTTSWSFAWTPSALGTVTLMSRGFDDSGNLEGTSGEGPPNVISVNVTAPVPPSCPCTLFQPTDAPVLQRGNDGQSIEVGMKFRSTVNGFVTALRYYKGTGTTGTHVGHLWATDQTKLAEATFTGESASGWQEVPLSPAVAITAGTTYVVSQFSPSGDYPDTDPFFTTALVNGPLRGLADGEDGHNGVYFESPTSTYPSNNYQTSNYYVDVVFSTATGPDVTPPTVVSTVPGNGATGVATGVTITGLFSEALQPATVTGATVQLTGPGAIPVAGSVSYVSSTRSVQFTPSSQLANSTLYTATLVGGPGGIADLAGNLLAASVTWTFTTAAPPPPPPTEGPGGPILVISSAANPFSRYPVEILRAEGLNEFTAMDLSLVTPTVLAAYDVVVLGECSLSAADATMLGDWTTAGGTLIAFRPDAQLAPLLGLTPAAGSLSNGYLLVNTASGPGVGIVSQTMQFHGTADLYTLNGASALATLYSGAGTATPNPAVTTRNVGTSGGRAIAFTYDLARSVVYTRQGNPAWAGTKRDGQIEPIRSDDMFFGNAAGDPQPDWVDFNKIAIPQADEQQRLFANALLEANLHRKPLPRFWYLPKGFKAAIVMTGDNHGDYGMEPRFEIYRTQSTPGCSVDDWECVRATGYLYLGSSFTPAQATFYKSLGFEVSLHINTNCARFTPSEYESIVSDQTAAFAAKYPDIPLVTNRNHCISFPDWSTTPEIESAHGIRFDTNYYYWPGSWIQDRPGMFTGSGIPMRFAKLDGTIIDCYQATTQMPDESSESFPAFCDALLQKATGPEGYYGVFTTNMHFDTSPHAGSDAVVASAQAHGVPVVSSQQMLTWLDGRNGSSFAGLAWSGNQLSFSIAVGTGARNLRAMLPTLAAAGHLTTLTRDGSPVPVTTQTVKGLEYAFFPADAGAYAATYAADVTPPVISARVATPTGATTETVQWTTDEPSDSRVDYGVTAGSLSLSATDPALVTSHSLALTGLVAGTTYYCRVTSADAAANAATDPNPPAAPATFQLPVPPCFVDRTDADFGQGTTDANTSIALSGDGEVILKPALQAEFTGSALPGDWTSGIWNAGGAVTVAGGVLTVDGAHASSNASFGPGRSLEFRATFSAGAFQNVGFAGDAGFNNPWVVIGEGSSTDGVYARTELGDNILLSNATLGTPHVYRIDWSSAGVFAFSIDGTLVTTLNRVIGSNLVAMVSDFNTGGGALSVDWLRVTPYSSAGSFTSRVFDSGHATYWGTASWTALTPTGTSVAVLARGGNTPAPDGTWSAFAATTNGAALGLHSRYLQYRADLATTAPGATPELQDVSIRCDGTPDVTPPVITALAASPASGGASATITWTTNEGATSVVDYGTNPAALTQQVAIGTLVTTHSVPLSGLTAGTLYYYRATSADAQANSATSPNPPAAPASFTTAAPACFVDRTETDFSAGTRTSTYVTVNDDGELTLQPALASEFSGSALPGDWSSAAWGGGGVATVAGGALTVDGAHVYSNASFGPGSSLEFRATFSSASFQYIGFAASGNVDSPWIVIGEGGSTDGVYARMDGAGDVLMSAAALGTPHVYRIDWTAGGFAFSFDGTLVTTFSRTVSSNLVALVSDISPGGGTLAVDWLRVTPYAPSGSFDSRVYDAGGTVTWSTISWNADLPAGTSLGFSVRHGDTPVPDGTWTAFAPAAASGAALSGASRYFQYRAALATTAPALAPSVRDVSVSCLQCNGSQAPAAIADLSVTRQASGGGAGLLPIAVTYTAPPGATAIEVYRAPFGGYPRYDEAGGVTPVTPAYPPPAPWTLTTVTASGQSDLPPGRDQWHYVAFARNACGTASTVSNRPTGVLDYKLGDVTDGVSLCTGDNVVGTSDISLLGAHYGETITGTEGYACLDVGPTTDGYVTGRPLTDRQLDFEDLVLFALEYTVTGGGAITASAQPAQPALAASDGLRLEAPAQVRAGQAFDVLVHMEGAGRLQGVSIQLDWDPVIARPLTMTSGGWLEGQNGVVYSARPGRVDAALLGKRSTGIAGSGTLAVFSFRALADGEPALALASVQARDGSNRPVPLEGALAAPQLPTVTAFDRVAPNPFSDRASVRFSLSQDGPVDVSIYSVDGRRVRTLVRGALPAGTHTFDWDRNDDQGNRMEPGLYLVRLTTAQGRFTRKLTMIR